LAKRKQARTVDSECEWHTHLVSAFHRGADGVGGAPDAQEKGRARRSTTRCHSAIAALKAPWHTTASHAFAAHVRAVPFELLSSFSKIDDVDVSHSQL
jgi:hypothetical protein